MIELVQNITLLTGLILALVAGGQDFKTHKPTIIMPAMILIGLSQSIIIGMIIFIFAAISLFFLPNSVNKVFGKADIFFLASMVLLITTIKTIAFLPIIIIASFATLLLIIDHIIKKPNEFMPWVGLYVGGFVITGVMYLIGLLLMRFI